MILCGLHGNEPAGVLAAQRVFEELEQLAPQVSGQVVALCGNLRALQAGQRFASRDLNRIWTETELRGLRSNREPDHEAVEMAALLDELEPMLAAGWSRVALLDLHSTSAQGPPSVICADTLSNRQVAKGLGMPVLLGLEETLPGTLLSYFSERGHISICVEGGQNDSPSTVDHHEAAIWLTMASLGFLQGQKLPQFERSRACLCATSNCSLSFIEVRHRQPVGDQQGFWMEHGFTHFHPISQDRLLAHIECDGIRVALKAPMDGLLLMPRYQGLGTDGYFIGRVVRPRWLWLSRLLRNLHAQWILVCFTAVKRDPASPRRLWVERQGRGPLLRDLLVLFGYRECSSLGDRLTYLRRPQ